jgi:hypothetical protein
MMLTFPILNGIGLVMTGNAGAALKASTMLPMIAVNGLVCAGYMSCFELASMRDKPRPRVALWLALAGLLVWLLVFLPAFEVPPAWQLYFIGAYSVLAIWLSIGFWAQPTKSASRNSAKHPDRAWVAGFAALLFLLLVFALVGQQFIPQIGQLSAFPILPLFGLVATAKNSDDVIQTLKELKATVLLGPIVAMMFVALLWSHVGKMHWAAETLAILLPSWIACGIAIGIIVIVYNVIEQ